MTFHALLVWQLLIIALLTVGISIVLMVGEDERSHVDTQAATGARIAKSTVHTDRRIITKPEQVKERGDAVVPSSSLKHAA